MNDGWWMRLFWLTHSWVLLLKLRHINCIAWCFLCPISGEVYEHPSCEAALFAILRRPSKLVQCLDSAINHSGLIIESCTWLKLFLPWWLPILSPEDSLLTRVPPSTCDGQPCDCLAHGNSASEQFIHAMSFRWAERLYIAKVKKS